MPTTITELAEELNMIAEYAGLDLEFEVKPGPQAHQGLVCIGETEALVDLSWALGNAKRLPDRVSKVQVLDAVRLSHPDIKGLSDKNPERVS